MPPRTAIADAAGARAGALRDLAHPREHHARHREHDAEPREHEPARSLAEHDAVALGDCPAGRARLVREVAPDVSSKR